jgi:hypothetical protein
MRETAEVLLGLLPADVQYADVRVVRRTHELVLVELEGRGDAGYEESVGVGLRVLVGGQWGFAATHRMDRAGLYAAELGMPRSQRSAYPGLVDGWRRRHQWLVRPLGRQSSAHGRASGRGPSPTMNSVLARRAMKALVADRWRCRRPRLQAASWSRAGAATRCPR